MTRAEHDLRAALRAADWNAMLPRLANYAERRLRWAGWICDGENEFHSLTAHELVNVAVERCCNGKRKWYVDSGYPNLESFLKWTIRSLLSSEVKGDERDRAELAVDGEVDGVSEEPSPEDITAERERTEVIKAIDACVKGDDDLETFYCTVLDGHVRPGDIAEVLGWSPDRASAARVKLQRRLTAQYPQLFGLSKKVRAA